MSEGGSEPGREGGRERGREEGRYSHQLIIARCVAWQTGRTYWGPRCFGAGIQNFLFADPRTVFEVEECVRAVRSEYPHAKFPGLHGVGMRRDVGFVLEGSSQALVQVSWLVSTR